MAPKLIPLLEQLAEEIHQVPICLNSFYKKLKKYIAGLLLGISSALVIVGSVQYISMPSSYENIIVEPFWLYLHTFIFGSVGVLLLAVLTILTLGKKSGFHLVLSEIILIGGVGSFLMSYTQLEHINRAYDESEAEVFYVNILNKREVTTNNNQKYYLRTEGWDGNNQRQEIRVNSDLYSASSIGGKLSVHQKSGRLGYRWVPRLYAMNKVYYGNN
ncbi:hypothetical protein [Neptuniibacter sp. QD34_54]|uniref:hypothetical protein n=1 Tax=Neptuniibacter sp. QD34_54 TaxID=3398208 RepID=UPI0039F545D3